MAIMIPLELAAEFAERAYRRGYQQAMTMAQGDHPIAVDLWRWRYETPASRAVCPDTGRPIPTLETSLARLECEEYHLIEPYIYGDKK